MWLTIQLGEGGEGDINNNLLTIKTQCFKIKTFSFFKDSNPLLNSTAGLFFIRNAVHTWTINVGLHDHFMLSIIAYISRNLSLTGRYANSCKYI